MAKITFVNSAGERTTVDCTEGESLMLGAMNNDIEGIVGECGGSMSCATCHIYLEEADLHRFAPRSDNEEDMLDCAMSEVRPTSRLSCQITVEPELDGLVVHLPEEQ